MSHFHPDIHWLTDYAAGNLPLSQALCISVHLSFCSQCRNDIEQLNSLGGMIFSDTSNTLNNDTDDSSTPISDSARLKMLDLITSQEPNSGGPLSAVSEAVNVSASSPAEQASLPRCLDKLLTGGVDQLEWKKLSSSLSVARLAAGDTEREVALHKIKAGGGVANHDHTGREVTVVLTGSFSDQNGLYLPGDFLVKEAGEPHKPMASADSECVCLSVLDAPVKFTGALARLLNPFLRIYPSVG